MSDVNPFAQYVDAPNPFAQYTSQPAASDEGASGPLGDAQPGSWAHMGNWASGQVRDLGHAALTTTLRAGGGLLDQLYGVAGPEYGGNNPGTVLADKFFDNVVPAYQPKTGIGRTAMAATEGGLSGALFGPGAAALGAAGAGSADAAAQATNDNPFVSGAVGLAVPAILGHPYGKFNSAESMVARRTGDMTPADWARAQGLQGRSNDIGAPLLSTEAMNNPAMHQLTADVMSSPMGGPIHDAIAARPNQVRSAVNNEVLDLTTRQPLTTEGTATSVQEAAEKVIQNAEKERSKQTSPYYKAGATDNVPPDQVTALVDHLDNLISADPANLNPTLRQARTALVKSEAVPAVPATRGQYVNGQYQAATPGSPAQPLVPFTDIATLDRARKILRDKVELPPTAADAVGQTAAGETGGRLGELRDAMTSASPNFAYGRALHEQISNAVVDPLARSPIGTLADRAGIPENRGIQSQINTISNPATARPEQIRFISGHLNMTDPTAFPALARTYFENAFDAVQKGPRANLDNPASGVDFVKSVNGTDQQRANNRAILEGVAQAHGVSATGLIAGFDNAMEIFSRMGKIPNIGSPTVSRGAAAAEASTGLGTKIPGFQFDRPLSMLSDKLKGVYYERAYRSLAGAITSPDGVEQLRQLSMLNPSSRQAQAIVGTMIGAASGAEQPTQ